MLGMTEDKAMQLAMRLAHDAIPPARLRVLWDLAVHSQEQSSLSAVRNRTQIPRNSLDRTLQERPTSCLP